MSNASIPRPEFPRPQWVREEWVNLNGTWQFERDPGRSGEQRGLPTADRLSGEIVVPFPPESALSGVACKDFMPSVWYRRTVTIPERWRHRRIRLHFGAIDYKARVWINGREAGSHRGGYTPFALEITDFLKAGKNGIVVCAEDDTRSPLQPSGKQSSQYHSHGCSYTRVTGIWQTVWLEAVPETYLAEAKLTPDLEGARLFIEAKVDGPAKGMTLIATAFADGVEVGRTHAVCVGNRATAVIELSGVRAWSPEDPFLYDLDLRLEQAGHPVDRVRSYFGLRSIALDPPAILLNGKPAFQRLVLDQGYYPDGIYTAPSDEALKRDIEISLGLGFNGARLHQKVFEPRFLYWADRLGYLVWGEFGSWGLDVRRPEALGRFTTEWMEVLGRDYNHPSLVGWCPFNETGPGRGQNPETLRTVYRLTKMFDATRPVIDTSGYTHVATDVYDAHDYDQNPETFAQRHRPFAEGKPPFRNYPDTDAPYRGQPYFISEYGGIWWKPGQNEEDSAWGYGGKEGRPKSEEEFLSRYRGLTEVLLRHPRMCGFCYTQLYDVEQEVNGLYTYDRQAKFDPEKIRAVNSQRAAIEENKEAESGL
ncbi:MAG: beta-galactosidase [Candidatus Latescibacteria bacterium]|nr:beta-galactosidase [Candidatus Latescibacterota bacterium]